MPRPDDTRLNVHQRITRQILAQLEAGVRPWACPWQGVNSLGRPLRHDGTPYRGINVLLLWSTALTQGFEAATWMTFRQALALGGHVRKGERGAMVVYANKLSRTDKDETGEDVERSIPFLKAYTVFNRDQIDGLPQDDRPTITPLSQAQRVAAAEDFFGATGADVAHGGGIACYIPGQDQVRMPAFETFIDAHGYYATLGHELVHWTQHKSRLDRDFGARRFGDAAYAREELVAELGAAFLCADLGLALEAREDHAAYLDHWVSILNGDTRFIVAAAAHAQRAVDYLHGLQTPP